MDKDEAIELFGGRAELAAAIGITPQAVSDWPERLSNRVTDRVLAAAIRHGKGEDAIALLGTSTRSAA